ncbi:ATP-binding protein [Undibacterium sp. Di24W]|uniref:ATP-binding protein n=1 Tax=Undibacterium sp. Di24W TaxID=3413033 RepID=UPI003BF142B6
MTPLMNNACLDREIAWFGRICDARFQSYFTDHESDISLHEVCPAPEFDREPCAYSEVITKLDLGYEERVIIMLALIPHLRPQLLDMFCLQNVTLARPYSEIGGWRGKSHLGFLPTCETAAFILAGSDLNQRQRVASLLKDEHTLIRHGILRLESPAPGEPAFSATLQISHEYLQRLVDGEAHKPDFNSNFPAKLMQTPLNWEDLVLNNEVMDEVNNIVTWLRHARMILDDWGLQRSLKPGYHTLFFGPPGTGKTLTASLIGKAVNADVYRIDLSMVVSKYIGETEKNLANVFDQAQNKRWILFFDEADSLFGKRTQTSNSNDRHANQEISYLLQRVEDFPGVVIFATNLKANIDATFSRRLQSEVYFAMPDAMQRERLWKNLFNDPQRLAPDINFRAIAERYELAGDALLNVARYAAIRAVKNQRQTITQDDLLRGIGRELMKDGKTL